MAEKNKKKKAVLSKSTFIKGLQCPKALYLHKNRYFLRDPLSAEQLARFSRGTNVGVYAHNLFPGGVDASPKTHFQMAQSVFTTAALLQRSDVHVIYEAAFEYDEVIVALDILYRENGQWKGTEVKSSRSISDTYRWDAALQYYVITGSGLELEDFSLAYINEHYVKEGPVDARLLFFQESLIEDVKQRHATVGQKIRELKDVTRLKNSPPVSIGLHCKHPYPCDFSGHCWKKVPRDSVFLLDDITDEQKFEWYHSGIVSVSDLPDKEVDEKKLKIQVQSIQEKKGVVEKAALSMYLETDGIAGIFHPFVFAPVIPVFDQTSPYQPLPLGTGAGSTESFLPEIFLEDYASYSPEGAVSNLLKISQKFDCLWVFDSAEVRLLLDSCKKLFPALSDKLDGVSAKMKDLLAPLREGLIVYPGLKAPLMPEKILFHFGAESIQPDKKCMVPAQVDALYQKLIAGSQVENTLEDEACLKTYMHAQTENMYRLYQLWLNFTR